MESSSSNGGDTFWMDLAKEFLAKKEPHSKDNPQSPRRSVVDTTELYAHSHLVVESENPKKRKKESHVANDLIRSVKRVQNDSIEKHSQKGSISYEAVVISSAQHHDETVPSSSAQATVLLKAMPTIEHSIEPPSSQRLLRLQQESEFASPFREMSTLSLAAAEQDRSTSFTISTGSQKHPECARSVNQQHTGSSNLLVTRARQRSFLDDEDFEIFIDGSKAAVPKPFVTSKKSR